MGMKPHVPTNDTYLPTTRTHQTHILTSGKLITLK